MYKNRCIIKTVLNCWSVLNQHCPLLTDDVSYGAAHENSMGHNAWGNLWATQLFEQQEYLKRDDDYTPLTIGAIVDKTVRARDPRRVARKRKREKENALEPAARTASGRTLDAPEADAADKEEREDREEREQPSTASVTPATSSDAADDDDDDDDNDNDDDNHDDELANLYGYKDGDILPGSAAPLSYKRDIHRPATWTARETQRFFRALSMFKLSFSLIANFFPGRETRDIRAKYKRELTVNESKVSAALRKHRPVDEARYSEYKKASETIRKLKQGESSMSNQNDTEGLNPLKVYPPPHTIPTLFFLFLFSPYISPTRPPLQDYDSFDCVHINPNDPTFIPGMTEPAHRPTQADAALQGLLDSEFAPDTSDLTQLVAETTSSMPIPEDIDMEAGWDWSTG